MLHKLKSKIKLLANRLSVPKKKLEHKFKYSLPSHISNRFIQLHEQQYNLIKLSLEKHYFAGLSKEYLDSEIGKNDMQAHLQNRLYGFRNSVIPWLDSVRPLSGAQILEIGCGTGSSTVAMAEQGAKIIGVDIEEKSIEVAKERCKVYGLEAEFFNTNAVDVNQLFSDKKFDYIIFFATLEHMTHEERMKAMNTTWQMLSDGGLWGVIETPNRLWFYDKHTSLLPFFYWLPDDLAFKYSKFSERINFKEIYHEYTDERSLHFLRRGRGVSYHEFELTMGKIDKLNVVSSMSSFLRERATPEEDLRYKASKDFLYKEFLRNVGPQQLHEGFYEPYLDLLVRKG
jgi:2-polyprenyl-3-methyl-5-hydroxy-6-metoxy-1,4-benzoquinol methylase